MPSSPIQALPLTGLLLVAVSGFLILLLAIRALSQPRRRVDELTAVIPAVLSFDSRGLWRSRRA